MKIKSAMIRFLLFHIFTRCQHCFNYHNRNLFSLSIFFCNILMLYWGQLLLQLSQDVISTNSKQKSNQHNNKKLGYISKKQPFLFINYQQNQRNHHVCISSERLADRFFIFISDLLTVVGVPAIDPVLKRAQFNQKINSLTQVLSTIHNHHLGPHGDHHAQDDSKKYKRNVSSETRRYAAIRLAASTSSLSQV